MSDKDSESFGRRQGPQRTFNVLDHLEAHLGRMKEGFAPAGSELRVIRFPDVPERGVDTFATLKLSDTVLRQKDGDIRQELMFSAYARYPGAEIAFFLSKVARTLQRSGRALAKREVMRGAPIIPGVASSAFMACVPDHLPEGLWVYEGAKPPVVIVFLLPLIPPEDSYILSHGRDAFTERYEEVEPDVWDLDRAPIVTHG